MERFLNSYRSCVSNLTRIAATCETTQQQRSRDWQSEQVRTSYKLIWAPVCDHMSVIFINCLRIFSKKSCHLVFAVRWIGFQNFGKGPAPPVRTGPLKFYKKSPTKGILSPTTPTHIQIWILLGCLQYLVTGTPSTPQPTIHIQIWILVGCLQYPMTGTFSTP